MDIEKPLEREFSLFAPEIAEKKIQHKGKNRDPDDDINFRGKIHSKKYLNYCRTVKPSLAGNRLTQIKAPYLLIFNTALM